MLASSPNTQVLPSARFIVNPRFDLGWFFGGAAIGLGMVGLFLHAGVSILALLWIWILCFDGPHMAAAYSRTFADRALWRTRPRLLLGSLLGFLAGPFALLCNVLFQSDQPFTLFLGGAALWGVYHLVRQHYGFLSLYRVLNQDRHDLRLDRFCLYLGCWLPYFYFSLTHPRMRALLRIPVTPAPLEGLLATALIVVWGLCIVAFSYRAIVRLLGRSDGPRCNTLPKLAYFLTTMFLYGLAYFVLARKEPVYAHSQGPDQDFMLISVLLAVFHNTEYIGLVWLHNRNRYGGTAEALVKQHGAAAFLSRSLWHYLGGLLLFSPLIYLGVACSTGVYPGCQLLTTAKLGPITWSQIGLSLWWGIAIQHYYLDQNIWRIRSDPTLRQSLGLVPTTDRAIL